MSKRIKKLGGAAALVLAVTLLLAATTVTVSVDALPYTTPGTGGHWVLASLGTTAGTQAANRDGWLITTANEAGAAYGYSVDPNGLQGAANFYKTSDSIYLSATIKTPAAFTGTTYLIGWLDQAPDANDPDPNDLAGSVGYYDNADLVEGAWFWFDGADPNHLYVGYKDQAEVAVTKYDTGTTLAVSTVYDLQISFSGERKPIFYVDGAAVHTATAALADVDLKPYLFVTGQAKTLYVRKFAAAKNW